MGNFADLVIDRSLALQSPIAAGIDPRPELLSDDLLRDHGHTPAGLAHAYELFAARVLDALVDVVPVIKIQVAFYEALGFPGVRAYIRTIRAAKQRGFLVIGDIKRGDVGSTAEAYASGHLGAVAALSGADVDAVTLNPYLGRDSLEPFLALAKSKGKGAFALVRTSNPGSRDLQDLLVGNRPLYRHVASKICAWGDEIRGISGYSSLGAVVGATFPRELAAIREEFPSLLLLIPGYGAQGGRPEDVSCALNMDGSGALIASSRSILLGFRTAIQAGRKPEDGVRLEAERMRDALRSTLAARRTNANR